MEKMELAKILRERYEKAKRNEAAMEIHLFGIEYADEIREGNYPVIELVELAGIGKGYAAEVSKGVKLASHVKILEG